MTTYWVFGKGVSLNQIVMPGPMQAGVPQAISPSMQRQVSHHTSLAAVVYGMMQASKRTSNVNTTRKYSESYQSIFYTTDWKIFVLSTLRTLRALLCVKYN